MGFGELFLLAVGLSMDAFAVSVCKGLSVKKAGLKESAICGGWFLDIVRQDDSDAIYGIPLLPGADLLAQYQHKGFGHLYVILENSENEQPSFEDMGENVRLFWSDEEWNMDSGFAIAS